VQQGGWREGCRCLRAGRGGRDGLGPPQPRKDPGGPGRFRVDGLRAPAQRLHRREDTGLEDMAKQATPALCHRRPRRVPLWAAPSALDGIRDGAAPLLTSAPFCRACVKRRAGPGGRLHRQHDQQLRGPPVHPSEDKVTGRACAPCLSSLAGKTISRPTDGLRYPPRVIPTSPLLSPHGPARAAARPFADSLGPRMFSASAVLESDSRRGGVLFGVPRGLLGCFERLAAMRRPLDASRGRRPRAVGFALLTCSPGPQGREGTLSLS